MSIENVSNEIFWKSMLKKHWKKLIPFVIAGIGVVLGGIFIFLIYINTAGYATWTFNDWSFASIIVFLFWFALWEFLIVGIPTCAFFGGLGYLIWRTLPEEERTEVKRRGKSEEEYKKHKEERGWKDKAAQGGKKGGGGGFLFVIWIIFLIKVAVDGNWNTTFDNLPLSYFVDTFLFALIWIVIIGVPIALIVFIIWFRKFLKE